MEETKDKLLSESKGKTVSVFYNDTMNSVSFKKGKMLDFDFYNLKIIETNGTLPTLIPRNKCIRIELKGEEKLAAKTR